jgi:hypothetical protein
MPTEAFEGSIHETQERISIDYVDLFGIHEIWLGHLKQGRSQEFILGSAGISSK